MAGKVLPITLAELQAGLDNAPPPTPDDQSRTWDGRVLNTKEAVLEFLAEVEEARAQGRSFWPDVPPK